MKKKHLAISTAWNFDGRSDIKKMLSEIREVGLDAIEIGYNFTAQAIKELKLLVDEMGIDVVSTYCFQSRTKYLQQKRHHPDVGCAIAEVQLNQDNTLSSSKIEFINMNGQIRKKDV